MIVFEDGKRASLSAVEGDAPVILFIREKDLEEDAQRLKLAHVILPPKDESAANRFESRVGFDCVMLNIPDKTEAVHAPPVNIDIYYTKSRLIFVHDPCTAVDKLLAKLDKEEGEPMPFSHVLYAFFNYLTEDDADELEEIEMAIATLEDEIAADRRGNYTDEISSLRKKLLKQKRYFESLLDTLEDMESNQNGFLTGEQLRYFHIITNRADRQFHAVLNLRDYVTQVREAYQAQLDISLNQTMKLFTVITAIFLPLTLIAGWYGMNFNMPEYRTVWGYPTVIGVSLLVIVGCVWYFRKHKWF